MRSFPRQASIIGLLLLSGCATAPAPASDDFVAVSRRPWLAICIGVCADYDVTVWDDGRVLAIRRHLDIPDEVDRFRVSRGEALKFHALLNPLRPSSFRQTRPNCDHHTDDVAPMLLQVTEIDIRWSNSASRLVACDNAEDRAIGKTLTAALATIHLNLDASRR